MNIEYFPVSTAKSSIQIVDEPTLASYIATEWLPKMPKSFMDGLTEVFRGILIRELIDGQEIWCANHDLTGIDRQWRSVTSWLIGVAFTRFVLEKKEKYPWWLPVSAIRNSTPGGSLVKTKTGHWDVPPPPTCFTIKKRLNVTSKLMPDYLFCKRSVPGKFEYAFVESKGSTTNVANRGSAPPAWVAQSKSAQLYYNGIEQNISRHIVVATRVNPSDEQKEKRKIIVRAWNQETNNQQSDPQMFAHFLANHYAAICWRIGYLRLAQLMNIVGNWIISETETDINEFIKQTTDEDFEELINILKDPDKFRSIFNNIGPYIIDYPDNPINFIFGERRYTARFTRSAFEIMGAIVSGSPEELPVTIDKILNGIVTLRRNLQQVSGNPLAVTLNGVAVFDASLLRFLRT